MRSGHGRPLAEAGYNITNLHLTREDYASVGRAGEAARSAGCAPSPELLSRLAVGQLLRCDLDAAQQTVDRVGEDPTGLAVVVRVALGQLRGDDGPLQAAFANRPDADPALLISGSQQLIDLSDCPTDEPLPPPAGSPAPAPPN